MSYDELYASSKPPEKKKEITQLVELPHDITDVKELAKIASVDAIRTLHQIALYGVSEPARVAASNALMDRGLGKPSQAVEITGKLTLAQLVEQSFTISKDAIDVE